MDCEETPNASQAQYWLTARKLRTEWATSIRSLKNQPNQTESISIKSDLKWRIVPHKRWSWKLAWSGWWGQNVNFRRTQEDVWESNLGPYFWVWGQTARDKEWCEFTSRWALKVTNQSKAIERSDYRERSPYRWNQLRKWRFEIGER